VWNTYTDTELTTFERKVKLNSMSQGTVYSIDVISNNYPSIK